MSAPVPKPSGTHGGHNKPSSATERLKRQKVTEAIKADASTTRHFTEKELRELEALGIDRAVVTGACQQEDIKVEQAS